MWQFWVPTNHLSTYWIPVMDTRALERTFRVERHRLVPTTNQRPAPHTNFRRIIVRQPHLSSHRLHFGLWYRANLLTTQYKWPDRTLVLNSCTAQLRLMQANQQMRSHVALLKWTTQLTYSVPTDLWSSTWVSYRSAAKNTFLWQMAYRILATICWRHQNSPSTDLDT